jgi:nicotinic acid phosphoribosyltransferase
VAIVASDAPIDGFGVGTAVSTSSDAPALSGVYKLAEIERDGRFVPVIKRGVVNSSRCCRARSADRLTVRRTRSESGLIPDCVFDRLLKGALTRMS